MLTVSDTFPVLLNIIPMVNSWDTTTEPPSAGILSGSGSVRYAYNTSPLSGSCANSPISDIRKASVMPLLVMNVSTLTILPSCLTTKLVVSHLEEITSVSANGFVALTPLPTLILVNVNLVLPAFTFACKSAPTSVMVAFDHSAIYSSYLTLLSSATLIFVFFDSTV